MVKINSFYIKLYPERIQILGIPFFNGKVDELFSSLREEGGLLTVPAAPALINIPKDKAYYDSLLNSDFIIADSGYMVLIWNLTFSPKISRISGLEFMNYLLDNIIQTKSKLFTINPSTTDARINTNYFISKGIESPNGYAYIAPFYQETVEDTALLSLIEVNKPNWILINIGGGTQEKLGFYLKKNLSYKPAIICTGAALAFKTGRQVKVTKWIDSLYLGWLARIIHNPKVFIPRYLSAFKLINLIFKYKSSKIPVL